MIIFNILTNKYLNNIHVYKSGNKYLHGRTGQALVTLKIDIQRPLIPRDEI